MKYPGVFLSSLILSSPLGCAVSLENGGEVSTVDSQKQIGENHSAPEVFFLDSSPYSINCKTVFNDNYPFNLNYCQKSDLPSKKVVISGVKYSGEIQVKIRRALKCIFATFDDKIVFTADSDAILTKGIIAVLVRSFSNQTASDILEANTDFIDEIGLKEHLSPTRANGLVSMIKKIKMYALAFEAKK